MNTFTIIYIIGWILIPAIGVFVAGFDKHETYTIHTTIMSCALYAVAWPLFLLAGIIAAPFIGIYYLGRYLGNTYRK